MKRYIKEGIIKYRNQIVIINEDTQILNPTEGMLLADGWEEYIVTFTESLESCKEDKKREIVEYDSSSTINVFFVNNAIMWLDKATRAGLKLRFEMEVAMNKETTTLWYEGTAYSLKVEDAISMLYKIEEYASQCYDNTQYHLNQLKSLTDINDVKTYDYTTGYPEKIYFEF